MGIELPGWLQYVGGLVGEKFPEGDETACRRQGDRWNHYADQLQGHQDAIQAAAKAALDGFASGVTHDALGPEVASLTSGDQSIEKIVEQLRTLAKAVDDAATEIEFAKEMFIVNLGILAVSLAAMIASAWINWGAPAEMAAAVAATEAVLSQIIRAAIGKIVSEAALKIIERLAITALEGAVMNAAISGGMNAAVQGGQILQGHRSGFDLASIGHDAGAGAIQGAVAAPFLKGAETRTPGFHPSERLSEFGRSFTGNTLGGLAAQAPSGQFDVANAAKGGVLFGAMDGARPTPKSIKNDWAAGGAPAEPVHGSDPKPEALPPRKSDLSDPAVTPPAHDSESTRGSDRVDVPLNLGTGDRTGGDPASTHTGGADLTNAPPAANSTTAAPSTSEPSSSTAPRPSDSPAGPPQSTAPRSSVSDTSVHSSSAAVDAPAARGVDSVAPQAFSGRDAVDTAHTAAPPTGIGRAETAPARAADLGGSRTAPGPELADPASPRPVDRADTAPPKPEGARSADGSQPQLDSGKAPSHTSDAPAKPTEVRASTDPGAGQPSPRKDAGAQPDSYYRDSGSPDAAALAPLVLGPAFVAGDGAAHVGSAGVPHEDRPPQPGSPRVPDRTASEPDHGERAPRAGLEPDDNARDTQPHHIDASTLAEYRQRQMELALSPEKLERDLLHGGCPPDLAASARHSPYEGLTRQELVDRYCNSDGSIHWPPHDGFADGRFNVADRIPEGQPLDRIGDISAQRGDFLGSAGDSYPARALAPGSSGPYHLLEGTGKPFSRPTWELRYGKVAEAFDQPGGGRQWVVVDTSKVIDGAPQKVLIDQLIKEGYVRVVEPDVDHAHVASSDEARPERVRQLVDEVHQAPHGPAGSGHMRHDQEPLFHGEELTANERQALRDVWQELSPDERRHLFSREPMFGEHAELPVTECDHYARQGIGDMRHEIMGRHEAVAENADRLRALDNIEECLDAKPDAAERFLLGFEPDGRSITAIGNPDTAKATVVFVPGTFTTDERLNDHLAKTGPANLFGLLDRPTKPGYMAISQRIWDRLSDKLATVDVAVVDYQNYHAPQSLANPVTGAPNPRFAQEGAPALRNHLDRLQRNNGTGEFWVAGHSYGTVLVGEGAKGGHGLSADGIINLGSPGLRVHDVSGLQLKGQHLMPGDAPVHTMTRIDDPIQLVDGARRTHLDYFGVGHGLMPHHAEFGGRVWHVDTNAGRQPDPHNAYFMPGSVALENIAKIVVGEQPPPEGPRTWTTHRPLPFTTGFFRPPSGESWSADSLGQSPPDLDDPLRQIRRDYGRTVADPSRRR